MQKVVLITGASSGLGLATALYLTKKGYVVFGTSRNPEKFTQSIPFELLPLEITDINSIETCVAEVLKRKKRVDVLINNAGVGITGPIEELDIKAISSNFNTNCFGPLQMIKSVLPKMREQSSGTIINITSIGGYMGLPFRGPYSASKSALSIITESLSMEVKNFGIKVICLAPGDFATDIASRRYHSPALEKSPYKKYKESLDTINKHVDQGNNPYEIAKAIDKILSKKNPRLHYEVGSFLQKLSKTLKKILPSRIFEKIIMNHYNL